MGKWQRFILLREGAKQLRERTQEWAVQGSVLTHKPHWGQSGSGLTSLEKGQLLLAPL